MAFATHAHINFRISDSARIRYVCSQPRASTSSNTGARPDPCARRLTRRAALSTAAYSALLAAVLPGTATRAAESGTTPSGLQYAIQKHGTGPEAIVGDLVGIRFKGTYDGKVFDDLFGSTDPYYYRVGSENILKGIDEAVQFMRVGDVYDLVLPPTLAFGKKGRRASAGKPSIPPNAEVKFVLELSGIPGREEELLERAD